MSQIAFYPSMTQFKISGGNYLNFQLLTKWRHPTESSSGVSWKECHPSERLSSVLIMIIQAAPSLMKSKVHFQFNACGHHHLRLMLLKFIIFTKILNDAKIFRNFYRGLSFENTFYKMSFEMSNSNCFQSFYSWNFLKKEHEFWML